MAARRWRLTKTALNGLNRNLDGLKRIVEYAAHRAGQMESIASDVSQDASLAVEYEKVRVAYQDVAKDVIARVDALTQECLAASGSADDAAGRAAKLRRGRRHSRSP